MYMLYELKPLLVVFFVGGNALKFSTCGTLPLIPPNRARCTSQPVVGLMASHEEALSQTANRRKSYWRLKGLTRSVAILQTPCSRSSSSLLNNWLDATLEVAPADIGLWVTSPSELCRAELGPDGRSLWVDKFVLNFLFNLHLRIRCK